MSTHYHPINCIVPPHMVDKIIENGGEAQIDRAKQTLNVSDEIRNLRQSLAEGCTESSRCSRRKEAPDL
jgi:hypothetical protein